MSRNSLIVEDDWLEELEPQDQVEEKFMEEVNKNLKPFCTVTDLSRYLGISKNKIYEFINSDLLVVKKILGREKLIYTKSVISIMRENSY